MFGYDFSIKKWSGFKKALRFSRNFFVIAFTCALLSLAIWEFKYLIYETSYFELKKISIEGNITVDKETIIKLSNFKLSENFLKLDYALAEKALSLHPKFKSVAVSTEGIGEVLIKVTEREGILLVLSDLNFYELDSEGYILSVNNKNVRVDLPILTGCQMPVKTVGSSIKADAKIKSVINWVINLEPSYLTNISEISLSGSELLLITNDGIKIFPGSTVNFKNNFELLNVVFNKFRKDGIQISYVDMRFNNEVVVKPITN